MSKIPKNSKFRDAKMVKMAIFDLLKSAKIDFTKNQWQENCQISTLENKTSVIPQHWRRRLICFFRQNEIGSKEIRKI